MPPRRVSSYTRNAPRPLVGSLWAWKPDVCPVLARVTAVRWSGEEWWVQTIALAEGPSRISGAVFPVVPAWNDLNVFWESCHYVVPEPGVPGIRGAVRRGSPQPDELRTIT